MWTFDNLPRERMKAAYGFTPDASWLDHARLSTLRFPSGTGAFISADGLVITNHHVAHSLILQLADRDHDYIREGFVARSHEEEIRVPGLELKCLASFEEITARVAKLVAGGKGEAAAAVEILRDEASHTDLRCELVNLYEGREIWIHRYRVFRDVRLVMAPEYGIAAFGKEWDNFSYPRHDLDFSLFRVYENGQIHHPKHFLKRSARGIASGEMTLVAGFPGRTSRQETLSQMEYRRDIQLPKVARSLDRQRHALMAYGARSSEAARRVSAELMSTENFYKVNAGELEQLRELGALEGVRKTEDKLREAVQKRPDLLRVTGDSWFRMAAAMRERSALASEEQLLVNRYRSLARGPLEGAIRVLNALNPKASAGLLEFEVEDLELEISLLAAGLQEAREELGAAHPLVKAMLAGSSPQAVAREAMMGSALLKPLTRGPLLDDPDLAKSRDPLLRLARIVGTHRDKLFSRLDSLDRMIEKQSQLIAKARFAIYGRTLYPDANSTLRLSYGAIESFPLNGTLAQPFTTFGGLYDRADGWGPSAEDGSWALPPRWIQHRSGVEPSTPLNFITSNDIIGGNSGSPVLNRVGEWVGLAFDGNHANPLGRYTYDPARNRAIAVDVRAILEALAKIYDAPHLAKEISTP